MLYRKEQSCRAKATMTNMNENRISIVAGSTWRAESEAVKQSYRELAARDEVNHALAFPGYRFTPRRVAHTALLKQETHGRGSETPDGTSHQQLPDDTNAGVGIDRQDAVLYQDLVQWLSDHAVLDGM